MKQCRVIITTECNMSCSYCCNKLPEIQESFKMLTMDELLQTKYDIYNITGGEIGLVVPKLKRLIQQLNINNQYKSKIYLYTNGVLQPISGSDRAFYREYIDGFNIGYHSAPLLMFLRRAFVLSDTAPTRIHIQDTKANLLDKYKKEIEKRNIQIKLWTLNQCETKKEDRFII